VDAPFRNAARGRPSLAQDFLRPPREPLGALVDAKDRPQHSQRASRVVEPPVDQKVGNAGLVLHPVRKRNVGLVDRAKVHDHVGLGGHHRFQIGRIAPTGEPADLRQVAYRGQKKR
jgi:hypothetical protein